MKKKRKRPMRCPYCGATVVYRSADGIYQNNKNGAMLYVCSRYPECDAYVRVQPGTTIPLGTLANGDLRALRRETHHYFDRLYTSGWIPSRKPITGWRISCRRPSPRPTLVTWENMPVSR